MIDNEFFCMSPWTHLNTNPNGDVITCCLSPTTEVLGNLNNNSIIEIWNSEKIKNLRINMLNNLPSENICNRCYSKEKDGFTSLRTSFNDKYAEKFEDVVASTLPDGTVEKFNLVHWDFRLSNICNLKCRTCGPGFSSQWTQDWNKLYSNGDNKFPALIQINQNSMKNLLSVILDNIDKVQSIHFAGGEPLIMSEHYIIIEELIKQKRFDVKLHYSTNFTNFKFGKKHIFDYWSKFDDIIITASIDAIGKRFNYIRNGSNWETVHNNLKAFKAFEFNPKAVRLLFHPTISVFNIDHFPALENYLIDNDHFQTVKPIGFYESYYGNAIIVNPLLYPEHYSCRILSQDLKEKISKKLKIHEEEVLKYLNYHNESIKSVSVFNDLIMFMNQEDLSYLYPTFLELTKKIDNLRHEDFYSTFPELNY